MPGVKSLDSAQYYAHPRNAFWNIMEELFSINSEDPYEVRLKALTENRVALWDVLQACRRSGSLDTSIDEKSIAVNDFGSFFKSHPNIQAIFFNGGKAEQVYRKYVMPKLSEQMRAHFTQRLPSTSPANARLTVTEKLEQWKIVHNYATTGI
jgi:hypoxanthine-DNA glycosylase